MMCILTGSAERRIIEDRTTTVYVLLYCSRSPAADHSRNRVSTTSQSSQL